jgi:hypothetical protein
MPRSRGWLSNGTPQALVVAVETEDRYEQARAHDGIAATHHITGDVDEARRHWQQALTIYTELGVPESDQIRTHLATIDNNSHETAVTSASRLPSRNVPSVQGTVRKPK